MEPEKAENALAPSKPKINKVKLVVVLAAIAIIAVLVLQNTKEVDTYILFAKITMPHALLLAITTGLGFVAGLFMATFRKRK